MTNALARWTLLLLSMLLLMPRAGLAAADAPLASTSERHAGWEVLPESSSGVPGTHARAPLRLMSEEADAWSEEPVRSHPALRIAAELGIGVLTSVGGTLVGGLAGAGLCGATGWGRSKLGCLGPAVLGGAGGLLLGIPVGVWTGGKLVGGEGSLLATLLGGALGAGAGLWLYSQVGEGTPYAIPLLGLAGSVIAYEISHHVATPARVATRPRLQPTLAVSAQGALLGLGGSF